MRIISLLLVLVAACAAPVLAQTQGVNSNVTAQANASSLPSGTYTAVVQKVIDAKHVVVKLTTGAQMTLTTDRANVDFNRVKPNDNLKFSIVNGEVAVFMVQQ